SLEGADRFGQRSPFVLLGDQIRSLPRWWSRRTLMTPRSSLRRPSAGGRAIWAEIVPRRRGKESPMDYAHARHAGNAGDVFKHVALIAALDALLEAAGRLHYFETHAGDGLYPLGSAGEWGTGVQRVW